MRFRKFFAILSIILCSTSFGEAYICNIDYHQDIRNASANPGVSAILCSDYYISGQKSSYTETIGGFGVKIICQNQIEIHVDLGSKITSDIIPHQDSSKRFYKSYVKGPSGLIISCQKRSLGHIEIQSLGEK